MEATRELESLRARSVNTLHAMARAVCDTDVLAETRMIGYMLAPEAVVSGKMLHDLRCAPVGWAHWSFLAELKEQVQVAKNLGSSVAWISR